MIKKHFGKPLSPFYRIKLHQQIKLIDKKEIIVGDYNTEVLITFFLTSSVTLIPQNI